MRNTLVPPAFIGSLAAYFWVSAQCSVKDGQGNRWLRVHGCLWDRHCFNHGAPPRITLTVGSHWWTVGLPLYWRGYVADGPGCVRLGWYWHKPEFFFWRSQNG